MDSASDDVHAATSYLLGRKNLSFRLLTIKYSSYSNASPPSVRELNFSDNAGSPARTARVVKEPGVVYPREKPSSKQSKDQVKKRVTAQLIIAEVVDQIGIQGDDPSIRQAIETAAAIAEYPVPVLIYGETGTGKGLFARLVHTLSGRSPDRFVAVNCGALPENLVESLLFGHRKGAFTGADQDQDGKFLMANEGTLFLDEIGELPMALQPKLLKVLEDGIVEPLGASQGRKVNVRLITATNRDLKAEISAGRFREDLYYRLSFTILELPSLRERPHDIRHIALHILKAFNQTLKDPKRLSSSALKRLEHQAWKGNVRDLENVIGRSVLLAQTPVLEADDLLIDEPQPEEDALAHLPLPRENFSLEEYLSSARKQLILKALEMARGKQAEAARLLGISPQAVNKFVHDQRD